MILRRTQEMVSGDLSAALARQPSSENCVVSLHTQVADYSLDGERFAVLSAWGGRQEVTLENRRIAVDDDTWLPIPSSPATVRVRSSEPVNVLTVLFRKGMPEEVLGTLITPEDRLLDDGEVPPTASLPFIPHLQTHDKGVTPVLLFIRRHCEMGLNDPLWFEEQFAFLLERMLARHRDVLQRARGVPVRRAATRREILRRVSLATDFIHSNFDKPLMLGDMARAAFLSRHHFLRLFKHIHEVTPHEYLQRKRTTVAGRLLRGSEMAVEDIVKVVGFDSRSTLFRALRRFHGVTPRECRRAADSLTFMGGMGVAAA
jgi:AraC family transcriptional regulator